MDGWFYIIKILCEKKIGCMTIPFLCVIVCNSLYLNRHLPFKEIRAVVVVVIASLLDLQLPMQLVSITTNVVSSDLAHGKVYSIQHYVIQFVSDLWKVSGFLRIPPPIKLTPRYN